MKKFFLVIGFLMMVLSSFSQDSITQSIRHNLDSILLRIASLKDETKQIDEFLNVYKSGVEAYPMMILEFAQQLEKISQKNNDPIIECGAWSFYGQGFRLSGNYIKALECHHKAVAIAEKTGNKSLLGIAQNQMAHIYKDREENEKALRLYRDAKENASIGINVDAKIWPSMNLGAIFLALNQLDSSLFYSKQAYDRTKELHITRNVPYILMNIGGAYSKMGNQSEAMTYITMAVQTAVESKSVRFMNLIYLGLAEHYQRYHQLDSSAYYAKKAIAAVQNTVFTTLSMKPSKLLIDIYENSNADSTLKYLKIFKSANDSLFSTRSNQQLQLLTFEEDRRQQELATAQEKYRNKIKTNILLGVLSTICLIAIILYRNNKQKQKANHQLQQQKEEIQSTLFKLKETQTQLVHSEKMASLGELTAGIAHEIQNPLNFVNNFADVNSELIAEMKQELDNGNLDEAKAIANIIDENEQKIIFHGKRADTIVKGMLQHSRSSSGVKEPTDINALADEYLRLAYHGLRAKDKSFNAKMITDFDESIGLVNVIPQEIGRVILNLITNAFYAVSPIAPKSPKGDFNSGNTVNDPTIWVSTKREDNKVFISVRDNGNGIPSNVIDKIFQPFFTTKPTGQGTGLGLSLSYDIVKAHGGELKVETKEGEGTEFVIQLPFLQPEKVPA